MCSTQTSTKLGKNNNYSSSSLLSSSLAALNTLVQSDDQSFTSFTLSAKIYVVYSRCSRAFFETKPLKSNYSRAGRYLSNDGRVCINSSANTTTLSLPSSFRTLNLTAKLKSMGRVTGSTVYKHFRTSTLASSTKLRISSNIIRY